MTNCDNLLTTAETDFVRWNNAFAKNKIRKRNGTVVKFDVSKVFKAVSKSFRGQECVDTYRYITGLVCHRLSRLPKYKPSSIIEIEDIQDCVESVLLNNFENVGKGFIAYREQRRRARDDKQLFDVTRIIGTYIDESDWRTKENSSMPYSIGGLILHNSGTMSSKYWLDEIYTPEIKNAHVSGAIHLHDLSILSSYCMGLSLRKFIAEGIPGINGNLASKPAKHMATICNQLVNAVGIHQNEAAGAQAFSSVDTLLAPFVRYDSLTFDQVKQCIQALIFGANTPSRWGSSSPFLNMTFDLKCPKDLEDVPAIIGGQPWGDYTYGDFQEEMSLINKAFLTIMTEGDANGRPFSYPIPTYNITKDFPWYSEIADMLFTMAGKYGLPYFQNFISSDLDPSAVRSMCCRLQLDKRELLKRGGGLFGADEFTGSLGVVTINLPQIGYLLRKEILEETSTGKQEYTTEDITERFWIEIKDKMDLARTSLLLKKKTIEYLTSIDMYPYTKHHIGHWNNHFLTIGLIGMNEALLNLFGKNIVNDEMKPIGVEILQRMRDQIIAYQLEDDKDGKNNLYNLEATPGESTCYRLARTDKKNYPDIIVSGNDNAEECYYTNSTQAPVDAFDDIFDMLDHQDDFQTKYTGGTVQHLLLGEQISAEAGKALIKKVFENYRLPYVSLTPTYSVCKEHGYLKGKQEICPKCGGEVEVYSRIVGYYRPVKNWNRGKAQEFKERVTFNIADNL